MELNKLYRIKKPNALYLVGQDVGSYLDYITYTSESSPISVINKDFKNLNVGNIEGENVIFKLMMKCDFDARGRDIMIVVVPKNENTNITGNPHNQFRVLSELQGEDLRLFWEIWNDIVQIMQNIGGDLVVTKVNSSSEEFGIYKGEYLKICQTLRNAIHAQIFGFKSTELVEVSKDNLTEKELTYVNRPLQELFNSLQHDLILHFKLKDNLYLHPETDALLIELEDKTIEELKDVSLVDQVIFKLFHEISALAYEFKKEPKNSTSGEIWKSLKLDSNDRPIIRDFDQYKNELDLLLDDRFGWISKKTRSLLHETYKQVSLNQKNGLVFRYGPNQCITIGVTKEKRLFTVVPTFYSGKGGDPMLGIFVGSEVRNLEEDEKENVQNLTKQVTEIFTDKFNTKFTQGDWNVEKFFDFFKIGKNY